ncbi:MAG: Two component transcriptional regulator, winged helix family [Candidatus Gottesmanbacteria bacterium GW2011_GWA1_34_13]|uniref:Two component transcriptional regulator, winged helix family n=1 Tax=Candidatus Gottesmanbacteria bacterium GW2011_GWA1_34_13 TaxID=1618434 RepID=A0A0G0AND9_9BACT|nr:MAG: Two component transcriptional regulator, winged helix family [Candidatus Gottesmanbacteria bacterium GW2011_GWA1_34_13]
MKILIIEDEHKIANSIKKGLELESYAVDVAYDGITGYDLVSTENYDVIILDLMLPDMDGIEICQKMRANSIQTPILMLTAKGQTQDKVKGLNSGADDYLVKPFAFVELLARIKALMRRPKNNSGIILKTNDLMLNTITYDVTRNGKKIKLSRQEFALLEYLLRHKNTVLNKEQIIGNVWDYDADILPNTIEVYIGYLRNKIDKPFPKNPNLIHTIRGFGYKLGEEI